MNHPIPDAALETDIATIGLKGSGKSILNRGLVERLLDDGRRVVILDPLGHWWGLKAKADGSEGYPVAVVGGEHADVPIDPAGGVALGAHIAESDLAVVIDVSELTRSQQIKFTTDLLMELYRVNRRALWLVLEESDIFAPQQPSTDGTRAMLDAADMIARRGRARGFRLWTLTQRPARLNKDLLTQASTLISLRITGPQDRGAIEDWMLGHVESKQTKAVIQTLAALDVGEGWVLNSALGMLERVRFPMCRTLDTSSTPKAGESRPRDVRLAKADLRALEALLGPGPRHDSPAPLPASAAAPASVRAPKSYEDGVRDGRRLGLQSALAEIARAEAVVRKLMGEKPAAALPGGKFGGLKPVEHHLQGLEKVYKSGYEDDDLPPDLRGEATLTLPRIEVRQPEPIPEREPSDAPLGKAALSMLQVICRHHPVKMTWGQVCQLDGGRSADGGSFNTARKQLRDGGYVGEMSDCVMALDKGLATFPPPAVQQRLIDVFAQTLPQPARDIFVCVRDRGPIDIPTLGMVLGKATTGGSWNTGMATLRRNNLIRVNGQVVTLSDWIKEA